MLISKYVMYKQWNIVYNTKRMLFKWKWNFVYYSIEFFRIKEMCLGKNSMQRLNMQWSTWVF